MPRVPDGFDVQGHRGARGLAPENTIPAFRRALDLGVTTLELDTVVSADRVVVVSHDPTMSPVFCAHPDGRPVAPDEEITLFGLPYAEIARFDCGSRLTPRFPEQVLQPAAKPTLAEVVRFAEAYAHEHGRPPVFYNVETKSTPEGDGRLHPPPGEFVRLLWEVVKTEGIAERFTLQSFDVRTLQEVRSLSLPVRLALLVEDTGRSPEKSLHSGLGALGFVPDIYSPDFRLVNEAVVAAAREAGMLVIPWTVNEVGDMERLRALGVDGLITDYPDRALGR
ncbi:MAG: glycerophosphodiester phosphodiesterase family protein [Bacteroidota bacterium]